MNTYRDLRETKAMTHTPEPWPEFEPGYAGKAIDRNDFDRARLCVNSCAGISNTALESGAIAELIEALTAWKEFTDELEHRSDPSDTIAMMRNRVHGKRIKQTNDALAKLKQ